jgi:hypothetical protein
MCDEDLRARHKELEQWRELSESLALDAGSVTETQDMRSKVQVA